MKPGIRAFSLRRLLYGACLLLLAGCNGAETVEGVVHYTGAGMLRSEVDAFSPVAASVDEVALHGNWEAVQLPYGIKRPVDAKAAAKAPDFAGVKKPPRVTTWFRIPLDKLQGRRGPFHFYLIRWLAAGEIAVYGDGVLIYRSTGSPVWNLFNHPALLLPLTRTADAFAPRVLLIRLDSLPEPDAAISSFYAGDSDRLIPMAGTRDWIAYQLPFMSSAAFLAVGMFSLAVWLFRRRQQMYLLLFAIAVTASIRRWHFQLGLERLPITDGWFIWLTLNALMWQNVALHYFLRLLHGKPQYWLTRALVVLAAGFSIATLPSNPVTPDMLALRPYAHLVLIGAAVVIVFGGLWNSWRSTSADARMLSAVYLLGFAFGLYDWARLKYVLDMESYYLTPYAAISLFVAFMVIMFRRYVGALGLVEHVNAGLEQRLAIREAELAGSYEHLRKVEQEQMLSTERQRLMQDMHDGLGSSLTSAIRSVERGVMSDAELTQVLKDCMDDLKLAIDSMEPTEADLLLLLATLRFRLAPRIKSSGVTLLWEVQELPALDWLDPSAALHILRIVQESIANILKHTHATEIRVATAAEDDGVQVIIEDNGKGFDVEKTLGAAAGRGLHNQQRRAQAIGGRVAWTSAPAGTRFTLRLPLTQGAAAVATPEIASQIGL